MRKKVFNKLIPILIIIIGLALVCYPWISEYVYEHGVQSLVQTYKEDSQSLDEEEKELILAQAHKYNELLLTSNIMLTDPFSLEDKNGDEYNYDSVLNYSGNGVMGFVDIPNIDVYLPIYHGTSNEVLEKGIGHLENTSLPVGGESTHCVLSGHTGLNSAKMFTDLTSMEIDDYFFLHVLGDSLAYKVIDISVVEPDDVSSLTIQEGRDLVTLVTCTPYGINSHRLLVTGERTEYDQQIYDSTPKSNDTAWMGTYRQAILIGILIVVVFFIIIKVIRKIRSKISKGAKKQ